MPPSLSESFTSAAALRETRDAALALADDLVAVRRIEVGQVDLALPRRLHGADPGDGHRGERRCPSVFSSDSQPGIVALSTSGSLSFSHTTCLGLRAGPRRSLSWPSGDLLERADGYAHRPGIRQSPPPWHRFHRARHAAAHMAPHTATHVHAARAHSWFGHDKSHHRPVSSWNPERHRRHNHWTMAARSLAGDVMQRTIEHADRGRRALGPRASGGGRPRNPACRSGSARPTTGATA